MRDFNYYAPTEVVFGEQAEEQVAKAEDMEKIYQMARG
jgi:alcohol dehydrogenase YqhD (iron-dependent ADH family)